MADLTVAQRVQRDADTDHLVKDPTAWRIAQKAWTDGFDAARTADPGGWAAAMKKLGWPAEDIAEIAATVGTADPGGLRERIEALPVCKVAMSSDPKWPDPHLHRKDVLAALTPEATAPDTRTITASVLEPMWRGFANGKDSEDPKTAETWRLAEEWVRHFLTPEATAPTDSLLRSSGIVDAIHRGVEALHKPGKCGDSEPLTPEATAPEACDVCLSFGHLSCDRCGHCLVRARERHRALTPEATAPDWQGRDAIDGGHSDR